jgi:hypothetical protein
MQFYFMTDCSNRRPNPTAFMAAGCYGQSRKETTKSRLRQRFGSIQRCENYTAELLIHLLSLRLLRTCLLDDFVVATRVIPFSSTTVANFFIPQKPQSWVSLVIPDISAQPLVPSVHITVRSRKPICLWHMFQPEN